jgi:DNA-binding PadR family transcriptional regulator
MEVTGLPSGTVYPALRRLERDGLVESNWEPEDEAMAKQRPARRYYEVTQAGKSVALTATERYPLLAHLVEEKR